MPVGPRRRGKTRSLRHRGHGSRYPSFSVGSASSSSHFLHPHLPRFEIDCHALLLKVAPHNYKSVSNSLASLTFVMKLA